MPSNVLVSGITPNEFAPPSDQNPNRLYLYNNILSGKSRYLTTDQLFEIFWDSGAWFIAPGSGTAAVGYEDVAEPWMVTTWTFEEAWSNGGIQVTEVPVSSDPTFGLPAATVALLTSRFGTVANFLRLRNQGQI